MTLTTLLFCCVPEMHCLHLLPALDIAVSHFTVVYVCF